MCRCDCVFSFKWRRPIETPQQRSLSSLQSLYFCGRRVPFIRTVQDSPCAAEQHRQTRREFGSIAPQIFWNWRLKRRSRRRHWKDCSCEWQSFYSYLSMLLFKKSGGEKISFLFPASYLFILAPALVVFHAVLDQLVCHLQLKCLKTILVNTCDRYCSSLYLNHQIKLLFFCRYI